MKEIHYCETRSPQMVHNISRAKSSFLINESVRGVCPVDILISYGNFLYAFMNFVSNKQTMMMSTNLLDFQRVSWILIALHKFPSSFLGFDSDITSVKLNANTYIYIFRWCCEILVVRQYNSLRQIENSAWKNRSWFMVPYVSVFHIAMAFYVEGKYEYWTITVPN